MREFVHASLCRNRTGRQQFPLHEMPPTGAVKYYLRFWHDKAPTRAFSTCRRWQPREKRKRLAVGIPLASSGSSRPSISVFHHSGRGPHQQIQPSLRDQISDHRTAARRLPAA